jgi:hypothetical protein
VEYTVRIPLDQISTFREESNYYCKGKVILVLNYVMKYCAMKAYWGSGGTAPPFLTSALDGGERSASRLCRFTFGVTAPGTHWMGGWVGLRVGPDAAPAGVSDPTPRLSSL